ncbi:hypothetical protein MCEMAEM4_03423 [Burkholderiaceae bacterium]
MLTEFSPVSLSVTTSLPSPPFSVADFKLTKYDVIAILSSPAPPSTVALSIPINVELTTNSSFPAPSKTLEVSTPVAGLLSTLDTVMVTLSLPSPMSMPPCHGAASWYKPRMKFSVESPLVVSDTLTNNWSLPAPALKVVFSTPTVARLSVVDPEDTTTWVKLSPAPISTELFNTPTA